MDTEEKGELARDLLQEVQDGEKKACTSFLTFDDVFWKVKKEVGFDKAIEVSDALLKMPNLSFVAVDEIILLNALELIKKYKLNPRDAVHLSCALNFDSKVIYSEDSDFDIVKELKREKL